jgi:hypothetical protein
MRALDLRNDAVDDTGADLGTTRQLARDLLQEGVAPVDCDRPSESERRSGDMGGAPVARLKRPRIPRRTSFLAPLRRGFLYSRSNPSNLPTAGGGSRPADAILALAIGVKPNWAASDTMWSPAARTTRTSGFYRGPSRSLISSACVVGSRSAIEASVSTEHFQCA